MTKQSDTHLVVRSCFGSVVMQCNSQSSCNRWCFTAASKSSSKPAHYQMDLLTWLEHKPQIPTVTSSCFVPTDYCISYHAHTWQKFTVSD